MKYPRNARLFRGQLDAAPLASIFFLLVIFLLLFSTHTFIPGVRVQLNGAEQPLRFPQRTLSIDAAGRMTLGERRYELPELEALWRGQARSGTPPQSLILITDPTADPSLVQRVRMLASELGVGFQAPAGRLELPEFAGFPGSSRPLVVVAVNVSGQVFLRHQIVPREEDLQEKLSLLVENSAHPLTMVLQVDKEVSFDKVVRLMNIGRKAGLHEVILATRPPIEAR